MPTTIFETCARWLLDQKESGWKVCHGFVLGDWDDEVFSHCWLEKSESNMVLDLSTGRAALFNADWYTDQFFAYAIDDYSKERLQRLIKARGHFGPYDDDLVALKARTLH